MLESTPDDDLALELSAQEPFLQRLARALVRDEHLAADLVQDTLAAGWSWGRRQGPGAWGGGNPRRMRGWLARVLRNTTIDSVRAEGRMSSLEVGDPEAVPDAELGPDGIALRLERQQLLHTSLRGLAGPMRDALVLRYQDGLTPGQMAEAMDCPLPTVKSRLRRGLDALKVELERRTEHGGEPGASWLAVIAPLAFPQANAPAAFAAPVAASSWIVLMAKPLALATVAFVLLGAALWLQQGPTLEPAGVAQAGAGEAPSAPSTSLQAAFADAQAASPKGGREQLVAGPADGPEGEPSDIYPVTGRVVSVMSGQAIPALVQGLGAAARAGVLDGAFLLTPGTQGEASLRVTYPGFEPLEVALVAPEGERAEDAIQDLGFLEMLPKAVMEVRVLDEQGAAVVGATCSVHRSLGRILEGRGPGPGELDHERPVGRTDEDGVVRFPLGLDAVFTAVDAGGRLGVIPVSSGGRATLRLDGPARELLVLDQDSGQPVVDRVFPMGWERGSRAGGLFLRTDAAGRAALPVGPGMLTLCKGEPRLMLGRMVVGDRATRDQGAHAFSVSDALRADEQLVTVYAGNRERSLRLVDAVTGEGIEGEAYLHLRRRDESGRWQALPAGEPYPVRGGTLIAHDWFVQPEERGEEGSKERWIAVAGYALKTISAKVDLADMSIALEPGETRRLRFLDAFGRPRAIGLQIVLDEGVQLRLRTGPGGMTPPLPWDPNQSWSIWAEGWGAGQEVFQVDQGEMAVESIVTLREESKGDAIVVTGVPPGAPPIFAVSEQGNVLAGTATAPETCELRGLAPGKYGVGTKEWAFQMVGRIRQAGGLAGGPVDQPQVMDDLLVTVIAGETVELAWDPRWAPGEVLRGQVHCDGVAGEDLAVLPVYGRPGSWIYFGPSTPWIPCAPDGSFRTREGDPAPAAFLFARFTHGVFGRRPVVLDSQMVRPDGTYRVGLTSYELVATNASDWADPELSLGQRPTIWNQADPQELNAPMNFLHGANFEDWNPAEPLVRGLLPSHIHEVRVQLRGLAEPIRVPVAPGAHRRIEIEVPLPQPREEGESLPMLRQAR